MRPLIICLLALLSPLTAHAAEFADIELADGRRYLGAAPEGIANPPLIIALHGGGGSPEQFSRDSGLAPAALRAGFAIVFPSGTSRRAIGPKVWNAGYCCGYAPAAGIDDQAFLTLVIKDAKHRYHADPGRIYITGMSNGAILAETYAATHPGSIRAVASVAGTMEVAHVRVRGAVPLLHIHGSADDHVPFAGGKGAKSYVQTDFASVEDDLAAFRMAIGKPLTAVSDVIDPANDGMRTERIRWQTADGHDQVVLLKVVGGGHHWPGGRRSDRRGATRDIDATREIIDFFRAQP